MRATNLLNFSLVLSFQGSSPWSAWDAILSFAGAAAHLRGTGDGGGGSSIREEAEARERRSMRLGWCSDVLNSSGATWSCDKIRALASAHYVSTLLGATSVVLTCFATAFMFTHLLRYPDCQRMIGFPYYRSWTN